MALSARPYWRYNKKPTDQQVAEDGQATFECEADGIPKPSVTWSINGRPYDGLSVLQHCRVVRVNRVADVPQGLASLPINVSKAKPDEYTGF